jgi:hypothetical protein
MVAWVERLRNPSARSVRVDTMGIAEFIIGGAFARPVGPTRLTNSAVLSTA